MHEELIARIAKVEDLTDRVRNITLKPTSGVLGYEPGQHVALVLERDGEELVRYYSIASCPHEDGCFELCTSTAGVAGEALRALRVGDEVRLRGPGGRFLLAEPVERDLIFVGSGTGLSPLRAMIQHLLAVAGDRRITLLAGVRHESDILYRREFEDAAAINPNFRFLPTLTRPTAHWRGLRGRVQEHLDRLLDDDVDIYVCGHPEMVAEVLTIVEKRSMPAERVHYERY